ncbi:hypothetical protein XELAEV_18016730mg [Xenopus laevis]|uniref:CCHC-type domain-containing protein n=1 Tax=Xenopus laevis TaxID=8355 RepID=A0A974DCE9_XENLA|nr:hypothetical protein XELAEV_18016730mg [Xenopus laevis]
MNPLGGENAGGNSGAQLKIAGNEECASGGREGDVDVRVSRIKAPQESVWGVPLDAAALAEGNDIKENVDGVEVLPRRVAGSVSRDKVQHLDYAGAVIGNVDRGSHVEGHDVGAMCARGLPQQFIMVAWVRLVPREEVECTQLTLAGAGMQYGLGEGLPPDTRVVMDKVLEMGFTAEDLNCFVHNSVFRDYSISFVRPQELDTFWFIFKQMELVGSFEGFEAVTVSRPSVVKVKIILDNESIPPSDLKVWISRYGKVVEDLEKDIGYKGVWTGGWWTRMRLKVVGHVTQHIPNSAYIGRDLIYCSYPGHVAKTCPKSIRCNLCRELGLAYGSCPSSWHKIDEEFHAQWDEAQVEEIVQVEVVEETQLSKESGSEADEEDLGPAFVSLVHLLSPLLSSFSGWDPIGVPQRGRGGGCQRGRPTPQWKRGSQGPLRSGSSQPDTNRIKKKVVGKPGSFPATGGLSSKERIRRVERSVKTTLVEWVKVGKKGSLDPSRGSEVCRRRDEALSVDTSNRYGPLSWRERVELEEESQDEKRSKGVCMKRI